MAKPLRLALGAAVWAAAAFGVLAINNIPGDYSHALCGPWG
jgi:hypothetical protein